MSYACLCIFADPRDPDEGWVELVDSWGEAAEYLLAHPGHAAYDIGDDGQPTGLVLRLDPEGAAFLADGRKEATVRFDPDGPTSYNPDYLSDDFLGLPDPEDAPNR